MKKSDLYKIIKQTIKEQRANKQSLKQKVKDIQQKINIQTGELEPLGKVTNPNMFAPIDQVINTKGVPTNPSNTGQQVQTWNADLCAASIAANSGNPIDYGEYRLYAGDCDFDGDLYEDLDDALICCSKENSDSDDEDSSQFVDSEWGEWDILDEYSAGGGGNATYCMCPNPNIDSNGDLIDCHGGTGNPNDIYTMSLINQFLAQNNTGDNLSNYTTFNDPASGGVLNNGAHCSGCYHSLALNDGERSDNSTPSGTVPAGTNTLLGCPDGGVYPEDDTSRDNISCCDFEVACATATVDYYNDGSLLASIQTGLAPNNISTIDTEGPSPTTGILATATGVFGSMVETGGCLFTGCADGPNSGNMATNYTSVVYAVGGTAGTYNGSSVINPDDGTCTPSVEGCTDPIGCNYSSAANTDDGTCEYTSCAGCMDDGTNDPGTDRANHPLFTTGVQACNNQDGGSTTYTISDPTACTYTSCVGCLDADGTDNTLYDSSRPTDLFWSGKPACNWDSGKTVGDPSDCNYTTCVGCTNQEACNAGDPANITVNDGTCEWISCYGCMTEMMNGDASQTAASIYSTAFTFNNTFASPGLPSDPAATPCAFTGCLDENDGATPPIDYLNFVCESQFALCTLDTPGPNATPCGSPCPTGVPNTFLGAFSDPNNVCNLNTLTGCTTPGDCNYDSLANTHDNSLCVGVPITCEECGTVVDANGATVNAVIPDEDCGCANPLACDFVTGLIAGNDGDVCVAIPGDCEICADVTWDPTNITPVIADPACNGCIDSTACNYGWYTVGGVLNYDPTSPILSGTSGITSDGSCVFPDSAACQICVDNIQPAGATNNSGVGWTEQDPACDGCAVPNACNFDSNASNDPQYNPTWESSCIIPNDCQECNAGNAVQTGDCECKDITAVRCNRPDEIHNFNCVTIDGNQPVLGMDFKVTTKMVAAAKKSSPGKGIKSFNNSIKEGYKKTNSKAIAIVEYVTPYSTLNEQIDPVDQLAFKKEPMGVNTKILTVTAVNAHPLPTNMPTDFPDAVCTNQNYVCHCYPHNHSTAGPGWPGHYHGCKATSDPVGGNVYEEMSECQTICNGNNQIAPVDGYGDIAHTNGSNDDSHLYNSPPMGNDVCAQGCKLPGYINSGGCCDQNSSNQGMIISNHDQSCCGPFITTTNTGTGGIGSGNTGNTGNTCFTPQTLITMEDETTKRIDKVEIGDVVKSEKETSNVTGIDIHKGTFEIYSINNSEAFVTEEHPFKTTDGWKAINPLTTLKKHGVEANVLKVGDILITKEGTEEIKSINQQTEMVNTVYNLKLDNEHVYYADNYLVHNGKEVGTGGGLDPWDDPYWDMDNGLGESLRNSQKLRESFKNQFMNSSKSDKEAKIRKTIRRIIRNNKK